VERLWDTGALWCRMNPAPGVWDFTALTSQLDAAQSRGSRSVIVVLGFPPAHAVAGAPNAGQAPWLCPEQGYASLLPGDGVWDDYVGRTVEQVRAWQVAHAGTAVHFQIWNEPAVTWFLSQDQSPQRLVDLARRARPIVKAALPGSLLVSPSIVPSRTAPKAAWQQAFVAAVAGESLFDVWAMHLYPVGGTSEQLWADYVWARDDVIATLEPARRAGDQVWVTEINANIAFSAPPSAVLSDPQQVQFVQAVSADLAAHAVAVVVWYRWHYDPWQVGSGQVVLADGSAALQALRGRR